MLTTVDQLALKFEFASTLIPLSGLRSIAVALRAGHSFQIFKQSTPPTPKNYWMSLSQDVVHEIFLLASSQEVTLAEIDDMLKNNFDLPLGQANQANLSEASRLSAPRPEHSTEWLKFETDNLVVNNPLGGARLDKIDEYRRQQLASGKSEQWFLEMVYADPACLSPIQKKVLLPSPVAEPAKEDESTADFERDISSAAQGKRVRRPVKRMGMEEYRDDEEEAQQQSSARSATTKRARVTKTISSSPQHFTDLDNHIFTHIRNQSVNQPTSNTGFFQKRTNDYLARVITIPPIQQISAEELTDRLVSLFGISRDKIKIQPAADMRDDQWKAENVYYNTVGKRIAKIIRDEVPAGSVVIFGAAISTVSRKVREMTPQTTQPSNNHSDSESSDDVEIISFTTTANVLARLGTTIVLPASITAPYAVNAEASESRVQTLMRSVSELELELSRRRDVRHHHSASSSTADDNLSISTSRRFV